MPFLTQHRLKVVGGIIFIIFIALLKAAQVAVKNLPKEPIKIPHRDPDQGFNTKGLNAFDRDFKNMMKKNMENLVLPTADTADTLPILHDPSIADPADDTETGDGDDDDDDTASLIRTGGRLLHGPDYYLA